MSSICLAHFLSLRPALVPAEDAGLAEDAAGGGVVLKAIRRQEDNLKCGISQMAKQRPGPPPPPNQTKARLDKTGRPGTGWVKLMSGRSSSTAVERS